MWMSRVRLERLSIFRGAAVVRCQILTKTDITFINQDREYSIK